ncbi:MacB family efflux pump subunit [Desulfobulbus oralis]|uniref:Pyoverdine export ATP-binding/permease protein PvdT n=1 Tax=Desulfobulbus oralis TaxID=1986146 RepID=A0A2L1GKZ2_9BACT|nr:MacB family efflux pump subunit [Desulfobulbus oralis]AVD70343.1 macrolide ABC transporter permease/ATP-binding protein MacB [Desulfobulbus oralis]
MASIITLEAVNKYYGQGANRIHVLKDISFAVEDGDFVAIIGQSGSGKSTLMNIIGCLDTQSSGVCRIAGADTASLLPDQLADLRGRFIGFIFQRYNLLPSLSAAENTALPAVYAGLGGRQRLERAARLLEGLGLADKTANLPAELSGGQQQRVSIARALMNGGRIILADEPTGALDSKSGENVMEILKGLNRQGHTIVVVTHDHGVAAHANRVVEILDGRIVADQRNREQAAVPPGAGHRSGRRSSLLSNKLDQCREAFRMSVQAILAHKMRSLLTMLGIVIGIASVVSVVALGNGSQQKIIEDINSMGSNTIDIMRGEGFGDRHAGRIHTLTVADADILGRQPYVAAVTPNTSNSGDLVFGNVTVTATLNGVGEQYFDVRSLEIEQGRFFTKDDVKATAGYTVIDHNTYSRLFQPGENVVGRVIMFRQKPLTIIGVLKRQDRSFGPGLDSLEIYAPYTTVMRRITGARFINSITVRAEDHVIPLMAEKKIIELLTARHKKQDFFTINTDSIRQTVENTTNTLKLLISGIAVISLVVGGIGVMNIMLVSVTERTREIGVRMAVGARQGNIMEQFLIEAVLLCLVGGVMGILFSRLVGWGLGMISDDFPMLYSSGITVVALACSSAIGIIFGFIPARNAARLNPIDALARE